VRGGSWGGGGVCAVLLGGVLVGGLMCRLVGCCGVVNSNGGGVVWLDGGVGCGGVGNVRGACVGWWGVVEGV
jgi:hypothetical protein